MFVLYRSRGSLPFTGLCHAFSALPRRCVAVAGWPVGVSTFCQTPTILLFACNRLCTSTVRPSPLCLPTLIRTLGPRCSFHPLVLILSPSSIVVASSRASRCNPRRAFPLRFSALWRLGGFHRRLSTRIRRRLSRCLPCGN